MGDEASAQTCASTQSTSAIEVIVMDISSGRDREQEPANQYGQDRDRRPAPGRGTMMTPARRQ
jgi:hypothetical protein